MSFAPVIPSSGLTGWRFLQATYDRQIEEFRKSPLQTREIEYFRNTIHSVSTAKELVADRRLMGVALGAFGLQDDINSRAFIRSILESDPDDRMSLVNRISDPRYKDLADAFAFRSPFGPNTSNSGFAASITSRYETLGFEIAVGQVSQDIRLALSAQRELSELAKENGSENTKWYKAMGRPPVRAFLETALGLPEGFGKIDLDQQLSSLKAKSKGYFGITSFKDFSDDHVMDKVVQRFQLLTQINNNSHMSSASIALQLLQ